jgi:hypothetical protein
MPLGTSDRLSVRRTETIRLKSPLHQVIIKNTSVSREPLSPSHINRSKSLPGSNSRIPVLAPSRGERARLEALLSDVWTRDKLPFPGMTIRARGEHLIRSSASSVMRKLSSVSITSSFRRSISHSSAGVDKGKEKEQVEEDEPMATELELDGLPSPEIHIRRLSTVPSARTEPRVSSSRSSELRDARGGDGVDDTEWEKRLADHRRHLNSIEHPGHEPSQATSFQLPQQRRSSPSLSNRSTTANLVDMPQVSQTITYQPPSAIANSYPGPSIHQSAITQSDTQKQSGDEQLPRSRRLLSRLAGHHHGKTVKQGIRGLFERRK